MNTLKKSLFSIVTIGFAVGIIVIIEFAVRFTSSVESRSLVSEKRYDQIDYYQINRSYLKKYFSPDDIIIPEFKPSIFRKEKTGDTFRIFCIGESSMFGVPYQMTANIPGILRRQLRERYPDKEIEVINLGASAINSNVIRHFAPELLEFKPDLILMYTGHNEFYGPDGITASWLEKLLPWITQLKYGIRNLSLYQLFATAPTVRTVSEPNLMMQVSNKARVDLHSPEADFVFRKFEDNLAAIITLFTDNNIPIIVSDITSNLTFPPFEFDTTSRQLQTVRVLTDRGRYTDAIESLLTMDTLAQPLSLYHFTLGRAYAGIARFDSAKIHFELARDNDRLKFRAPRQINTIIAAQCNRYGVPFFSSDSIFAAQSRNGISDTTLFWEHLHPKMNGYYLIANGFLDIIGTNGVIPENSRKALVPLHPDSLYICWFDRAFAERSMGSLTSKWPFRGYTVSIPIYSNASQELQSIVDDVLTLTKVWDEGCYETAKIFWREGRYHDAITTYRAVIEEYPYNFYAHYLLGSILNQQSKQEEAIRHYEISIRSNPGYPYPLSDLGLLLINRGEFDKAIQLLNQALFLGKQNNEVALQSTVHYGLAAAFANKKQYTEALSNIDRSLQLMPSNRDALALKQQIDLLR